MQNWLISAIAKKIREEIINSVKKKKYFTILLDSIPDKSHKKPLTLILRIVEALNISKSRILMYFIRFIHIASTTDLNLTEEI